MKNGGSLMQNAAAVIYTSGLDFMHSNKPAALREVVFRPMIDWVNEALDSAGISERCYVINEGEEDIRKYTGEYPVFIRKPESGHPLFTAKEWIDDHEEENFLAVSAEAVFTNPDVLKAAFERHISNSEKLTVIASAGRESFIKELSQSAFWITKTFLSEVSEKTDGEDKNGEKFLVEAMKILSDQQLGAATHVAGKKEINM
jgi:NDP-sugar pyrophosphorylase family protein